MSRKLTIDEAAEVTGRSAYTPALYREEFDRILEENEAEGFCEDLFPAVKPAHVAHVFRNFLKDDGEKGWLVARTEDYGVVLKPLS